MRSLFLILLVSPCLAAGPKYRYEDPKLNDEFTQVYHDIKSVLLGDVRISSVTIGTATISNLVGGSSVPSLASTQTWTGFNTFTSSVAIKGTASNDSAAAGYIGEYVESTVGSVSATGSTQFFDITSISLTAGDWDVSASGDWEGNGATWTEADFAISTTSGNSGTGQTTGYNFVRGSWASTSNVPAIFPVVIPSVRYQFTTTTTLYLKGRAVYSAGTPRFEGASIHARRVR